MSASAYAPTLRRVLHFRTIVSTSTGLAYAAISLLACVQVATYMAGDSAWIALLIAGALALLAAFCFYELNAPYPSAAAIRQYLRAAFNEKTSLTISFAYVLAVIAVIAADSYVVGSAVSFVFPQTPAILWILLILALAAGANLFGIRIAGLLQDITTFGLLVSLAIISIFVLSHNGFALHQPFAGLDNPGNLFNAVAVGVFVFSAFEWVTSLSEEMTDTRLIPRGMFIALGLVVVSYALFTLAATNLVGIAARKDSPAPQMLLGRATLGQAGVIWMLIATLFTGVMTFNGGFATASRFLYAAAREATLPPIFAHLSIARAVPWATVLILAGSSAAIAVEIDITREFNILIIVGAVLEALIYAAAGIYVIQLRRRQPGSERSFRIPLGWTIPLFAIVIFTLLGIAAAISPNPLPLLITGVVFVVSFAYVQMIVPRLKATDEVRRQARGRRRPPRRPAATTDGDSLAPMALEPGTTETQNP